MTLQVIKDQSVISSIKVVESIKRWTLNFTDIINNNNKYYNLELVKASNGAFYIFTVYGRVGAPNPAKEYRSCYNQAEAENEAEKIVKSKTKKGYVEVKLAKADVGSDVGKSKIDQTVSVESLKKMGAKVVEEPAVVSKLHTNVQDLIRTWFGVTQEFKALRLFGPVIGII
jgi:predicted DNA-binding WGR domain protein